MPILVASLPLMVIIQFTVNYSNFSILTQEIEAQYKSFLNKGLISKAQIIDEVFHGELAQQQNIINRRGTSIDIKIFRLKLPFIDRDVMEEWDKNGVDYSFKQQTVDWTGYFLNLLPWVLILGFWIFLMRRMQGLGLVTFHYGYFKKFILQMCLDLNLLHQKYDLGGLKI